MSGPGARPEIIWAQAPLEAPEAPALGRREPMDWELFREAVEPLQVAFEAEVVLRFPHLGKTYKEIRPQLPTKTFQALFRPYEDAWARLFIQFCADTDRRPEPPARVVEPPGPVWHLGKGLTTAGVVAGSLQRGKPAAALVTADSVEEPFCIWCNATPSRRVGGRLLARIGHGWNFECFGCRRTTNRHVRWWQGELEEIPTAYRPRRQVLDEAFWQQFDTPAPGAPGAPGAPHA